MTLTACLDCGEPSPSTRCADCTADRAPRARHDEHRSRSWKWRRLSARLRKAQPWCSLCSSVDDLTVDHVTPLSHGGAEYDLDNLRVLCRPCHGAAWAEQSPSVTGGVTGPSPGGLRPRGRRSLPLTPLSDAPGGPLVTDGDR